MAYDSAKLQRVFEAVKLQINLRHHNVPLDVYLEMKKSIEVRIFLSMTMASRNGEKHSCARS